MQNWRLGSLPDYAFPRMRALLSGIEPLGGQSTQDFNLSIGEPQHPFPDFIKDILAQNADGYGKYPPNNGTPEFREAVHAWLCQRFNLTPSFIDADAQIMPLNGTREGLFNAALAVLPLPQETQPAQQKPLVLIPNPYYQCYGAAGLAAGGETIYLPATKETGFLPDYTALDPSLLTQTSLVYLCAPANPQGAVASLDYWMTLLRLAKTHDFVIAADECYCEIYDKDAPIGVLDAAARLAAQKGFSDVLDHLLSFHSLSKRSNLPGLRSGFVTGGRDLLERLGRLRAYGGAPSPLPVLAAATAAWSDEAHVSANRALYRAKLDIAENIFGTRLGFYRPAGGFFLWLDVSEASLTGEEACVKLWREGGIKALPGAYLASETTPPGSLHIDPQSNPGHNYIRLALVHNLASTEKSLITVNQILV